MYFDTRLKYMYTLGFSLLYIYTIKYYYRREKGGKDGRRVDVSNLGYSNLSTPKIGKREWGLVVRGRRVTKTGFLLDLIMLWTIVLKVVFPISHSLFT